MPQRRNERGKIKVWCILVGLVYEEGLWLWEVENSCRTIHDTKHLITTEQLKNSS
jgi:hypothetical protein